MGGDGGRRDRLWWGNLSIAIAEVEVRRQAVTRSASSFRCPSLVLVL